MSPEVRSLEDGGEARRDDARPGVRSSWHPPGERDPRRVGGGLIAHVPLSSFGWVAPRTYCGTADAQSLREDLGVRVYCSLNEIPSVGPSRRQSG